MTARRILYIDDEPGLCRLVQRDLERHGYVVETAPDGTTGLAMAAAGGFAAICLDHYMPGQDGLETLAGLRALPCPPPVIYVTGSDEGRIAVAALRAGAADYVIKEVGEEFLLLLRSAIEVAIERAALVEARSQAEAAVRDARDRAEELASQRAVLLREVNHRVANSLQLIGSLARLQEGAVSDPAARNALAAMRNRIAAVAQVHRRLYTSDDVHSVALHEYLAGLLDEIGRSVGGRTIALDAEPLEVPTDRAVSLGVIVSELVTNALKYAYPDATEGPIRVRLRAEAGGGVLAVQDEGIGSAAGEPGGTGLGRRIVEALSASVGGEVEHQAGPGGTSVSIRFALG
ncbi:two-component system sensor histidine kinase/response regulator [Siccirubricoccus deserti]|uniref:histidine kinase n=1 Tax=Siccirubricoccus deserti TaxID=2013562 RepID=A0A9X0UHX9_9PROT|nr:histidine kinase dimerization/phosphoacceptor domain -containing protein [Siccirubricoccus deserti]MBC4016555.1 response regulator [Siccirubricoccus deserti]GGC50015.1 two-component system sensor histidine kinase/response regulator [Siccirubricoccus deserti]